MRSTIRVGLEILCDRPDRLPRDARRLAVLMNQASVDQSFRYACDVLAARFPGRIAALVSPQHGLWGEEQANMIETPHGVYQPLGVPLLSLYSETRCPTPEMLALWDCLIIDLQDVGTRVYTFVWTVLYCLEACARAGIPVVLLDRPNPLGGEVIEGPLLQTEFTSFVGRASIPMRHGLTIGELARWLNQQRQIGADLTVVPMQGWRRSMLWNDVRRPWIAPSPNLPRFESALLYPGQVLLEGTNLSEGRGTTQPFEIAGAPFVDPEQILPRLSANLTQGLAVMPFRFRPTFDKWTQESCGGVALRVVDASRVRSFALSVGLIQAVARVHPDQFRFLPPPYEYETAKMPIDILFGSDSLRLAIEAAQPDRLDQPPDITASSWWRSVEDALLYPR